MRFTFFIFVLAFFLCPACRQKAKSGATRPLADTLQTNSRAAVLNQITVHEKGGLQLARAYLTDSSGRLLNKDNSVQPGETVILHLAIKKGWVVADGFILPGATQTISTAEGEVVLSSPDLFAGRRLRPKEAVEIQLKTVLAKARNDSRGFFISYRLWDKNAAGVVAGFYRLYLATTPAP